MSAHYFDVIRFSSYVVFTAGLVCVCVYVFFTQKTKKEGKNVDCRGHDPVMSFFSKTRENMTAITCYKNGF